MTALTREDLARRQHFSADAYKTEESLEITGRNMRHRSIAIICAMMCLASCAVVVSAMERPSAEQLERYRSDGTLADRADEFVLHLVRHRGGDTVYIVLKGLATFRAGKALKERLK